MSYGKRSLAMRIETDDPLYPSMNKIKIKGKELCHIPPSLFGLDQLEVLDLSPEREACLSFKLYQVPPEIDRLVNLKILILDTNELLELPPEIGKLRCLQRFTASNNNLVTLPSTLSRLRQLRSLHLTNNSFTEFPGVICDLESLEFLDMSDNNLRELPENIGNLRELRTLMLFYNHLTSLPNSLCELVNLNCLWLGNNRLRRLPRNFANLRKLDLTSYYTTSVFHGNPLIYPPLEVCLMGLDAIDRYLSRSDQGRPLQRPARPHRKALSPRAENHGEDNSTNRINHYPELPAITVESNKLID